MAIFCLNLCNSYFPSSIRKKPKVFKMCSKFLHVLFIYCHFISISCHFPHWELGPAICISVLYFLSGFRLSLASKHSCDVWNLSLAFMSPSEGVYRDCCKLEIWFSHLTPLNFCHQFSREIYTISQTSQTWIRATQFPDLYLTRWKRQQAPTHISQHLLPSTITTALTVHLTHVC